MALGQFNLELGGAAAGAQAAGQGLGNIFKAYVMGPQIRQKAQMDTEDQLAGIYAKNMQGNQYGANARKLNADATDQEMTTRLRESIDAELAANPNLPAYERALRIGFKFAGPQHMQNWSAAAVNEKRIADLNAVQANSELAQATGLAYGATKGELPFASVNDGGYSVNRYTGNAIEANPVLAKLFSDKRQSEIAENRAQAFSANASAANSNANAGLTREKLRYLQERGFLPGTGEGGGESYALNPELSRVLRKPVLDAKGNPMTDMDGRPMMATDQEGMRQLFQWMVANNKTNANAALVEWEALGRPAANIPQGQQAAQDRAGGQQYRNADEVRAAYQSGALPRENALAILQRDYGMAPPAGQPQQPAASGIDAAITKAVNAVKQGASPATVKQRLAESGITEVHMLHEANASIARGNSPEGVLQRLRSVGVDANYLNGKLYVRQNGTWLEYFPPGAASPAPVAPAAQPQRAAPEAKATPAPNAAAKRTVAQVLGVDTRDNALNAIMKAKAQRIEAAAAEVKAARDAFAAAARSGDPRALQAYQGDMLAKTKAFNDLLADMNQGQADAVRKAAGM